MVSVAERKEPKPKELPALARDRAPSVVEKPTNPISAAQRKYPTEEEKPLDEHFRAYGMLAEEVVFEGKCHTCGGELDPFGLCAHEAHGD
ncbi:MAG: hypothetical protein KGI04_01900 [Candidatus Micrarchaeota archaeon]|nr:hypothetical protein [Candidatus Micrarchaeota archaeon]